MNLLLRKLEPHQLRHLQEQFNQLDKDQIGLLQVDVVKEECKKRGIKLEDPMLQSEVNENGLINYTDFVTATIETQNLITEELLWWLFGQFDT